MDQYARLTFKELTVATLLPPKFAPTDPVGIMADWYEDQGDTALAEVLRHVAL